MSTSSILDWLRPARVKNVFDLLDPTSTPAPEEVERPVALLAHQAGVLEDTASRDIIFVGGMGSGKTRTAALKAVQLAQLNIGIPVMYCMPTIPMLEDVAIPEVFDVLDEMGFVEGDDYVLEKRRRNLTIEFEDGQGIIRFRPTENPRRLVGPSVAAVVVDEAEDNKEDSIRILQTRIRHPRAKTKQFAAFGTPESLGGWFYTEAEGEKASTTNTVRARTSDNYLLDEDYEDRAFSRMTEEERDLYSKGLFVARRGRVYTHFDVAKHVRPIIDPGDGEQVMACDFGRGCMAWEMGRVVDDVVHFHGEQILEGSDTIIAAKQARTWWREFFLREMDLELSDEGAANMVSVYCDPAGEMKGSASDVRILREFGFNVYHHAQHPRIKDRVNAVQSKLEAGGFLIDGERAPYLVRCMQGQTYDKNGIPEKARPRDGKKGFDHANDAVGYLVAYKWPAALTKGWRVH